MEIKISLLHGTVSGQEKQLKAATYSGRTCETRPPLWVFLTTSIKAMCNKM